MWPVKRQAKQIPLSFKKEILSVCNFLLNRGQVPSRWLLEQNRQKGQVLTAEGLFCCFGEEGLTSTVAALVNLDFDTDLESVDLMVLLGVLLRGEVCISPNTGSVMILTCFSINSTKFLNAALRLVDS